MQYAIMNQKTGTNPYAVIEYKGEWLEPERMVWQVRISNLSWDDAEMIVDALTARGDA